MNKYNLPHYEVIEEIGETQQEIDLVNQECKNIYLGVWQGVLELCYDLYKYQTEHSIDTTYIAEEQQKVWESIYQALEEELLDDTDIEILRAYKLDWLRMTEQYYQKTKENK